MDELDITDEDRIGVLKPDALLYERECVINPQTDYDEHGMIKQEVLNQCGNAPVVKVANTNVYILTRGCKQYQLANHLGNVLATISDRKWSQQSTSTGSNADYFLPYIISIAVPIKNCVHFEFQIATHSKSGYAFGSNIKKRTFVVMSYSPDLVYVAVFSKKNAHNTLSGGFNNQEQDAEMGVPTKNIVYFEIIQNTTNSKSGYAFEYRIHDARLGRFLSVDPCAAKFCFQSVFCFGSNNPIALIEVGGAWPSPPMNANPQGVVQAGWGISQFCYYYGVSGATWVHQAHKVAQKNLVSFPDYPANGTLEDKRKYFLSNNYSLYNNQALYLPAGTQVTQYFHVSDWTGNATFSSAQYYECALRDPRFGSCPIVYDKPLINGKSVNSAALQKKSGDCIGVTGKAAEVENQLEKIKAGEVAFNKVVAQNIAARQTTWGKVKYYMSKDYSSSDCPFKTAGFGLDYESGISGNRGLGVVDIKYKLTTGVYGSSENSATLKNSASIEVAGGAKNPSNGIDLSQKNSAFFYLSLDFGNTNQYIQGTEIKFKNEVTTTFQFGYFKTSYNSTTGEFKIGFSSSKGITVKTVNSTMIKYTSRTGIMNN